MLLEEFDPNKKAVIDPGMYAPAVDDFPEVTISCFSKKLFQTLWNRVFEQFFTSPQKAKKINIKPPLRVLLCLLPHLKILKIT